MDLITSIYRAACHEILSPLGCLWSIWWVSLLTTKGFLNEIFKRLEEQINLKFQAPKVENLSRQSLLSFGLTLLMLLPLKWICEPRKEYLGCSIKIFYLYWWKAISKTLEEAKLIPPFSLYPKCHVHVFIIGHSCLLYLGSIYFSRLGILWMQGFYFFWMVSTLPVSDAFADQKWFSTSNFILFNLIIAQYLINEYSINYFTLIFHLAGLDFSKGKSAFFHNFHVLQCL